MCRCVSEKKYKEKLIWLFVLKSFYERADTFNIYYVASLHMCSLALEHVMSPNNVSSEG